MAKSEEFPPISDLDLRRLLDGAKEDETKYREALDHLAGQIAIAREVILSTNQSLYSPLFSKLSPAYRPLIQQPPIAEPSVQDADEAPMGIKAVTTCWEYLEVDAHHTAILIAEAFKSARDAMPASDADISKCQSRAQQTIRALRLYLLTQLYALRANVNEDAISTGVGKVDSVVPPTSDLWFRIKYNVTHMLGKKGAQALTPSNSDIDLRNPRNVIKSMNKRIHDYHQSVREWKLSLWLPLGEPRQNDAYSYSIWRSDFGAAIDAEPGWGPIARYARVMLRYRRYKAEFLAWWQDTVWRLSPSNPPRFHQLITIGRILWRLGLSIVLGLFLMAIFRFFLVVILRIVTFIALRPIIFAYMTVLTIPFFALLYFLDDYLLLPTNNTYGCSVVPSGNIITYFMRNIGHDLFSSIVTLTNFGDSSTHRGCLANPLLAIESLTGYFLLSILAALMYAWLTNP